MNQTERDEQQATVRLMRWPEVEEITGLTRQTLVKMAANDWFPKPVQVSAQITAFLSNEVEAWLEELKTRRVHYQNPEPWARRPFATQQSTTTA